MPVFTIETPTGRKLDIEAADEAGAVRGAQEWETKNPAREAATVERPTSEKLANFGRNVTPQGPISGLIALARLAGDASKGKVDLQSDEGINAAIPAVVEGSVAAAPSARARPMPRAPEAPPAAASGRLSNIAQTADSMVPAAEPDGLMSLLKDAAPHLASELLIPGSGLPSYVAKRIAVAAMKRAGGREEPSMAPAPAAPTPEVPVAAPVAPPAAPQTPAAPAAPFRDPALQQVLATMKARQAEAAPELTPDIVAQGQAVSKAMRATQQLQKRSGFTPEEPPGPVKITKTEGRVKAEAVQPKPVEVAALPESDYAHLDLPEAAAQVVAKVKADKPDFKFHYGEKNYADATLRRLTAKEGIASSVAQHVPNVPLQTLRAWLQGAKTRSDARGVMEHLKTLAPKSAEAISKAFTAEGLKAGWKK